LELVAQHRFDPAEIDRVSVTMSERNATVLRNHLPQSGLAAKFSIEFVMSAAIIAGRVGLAELTDDFVQRADVQRLMECVTVTFSELPADALTGYAPFDVVNVSTHRRGAFSSGPITLVKGSMQAPLSSPALEAKFLDCAAHAGTGDGKESAAALFERLAELDTLGDARLLCPR
jgi:2-methylcitrate dehydratase PrpD